MVFTEAGVISEEPHGNETDSDNDARDCELDLAVHFGLTKFEDED